MKIKILLTIIALTVLFVSINYHYKSTITKSKDFAKEYVIDMHKLGMTKKEMKDKVTKDVAIARDKKARREHLNIKEKMLLNNSGLKTGQGHALELIEKY